MASWDTNKNWDSQQTWDALPAQVILPRTKMITLITGIASLKPADQLTRLTAVENGLTTNAADFPNLPVPLATYSAKVAQVATNLSAITTAEAELKGLRLARPILLGEAQGMYSQNGSVVAGICGDDAVKAVKSGYQLAAEAAPIVSLGQVESLAATTGDNAGEMDVQHNPVPGAAAYEKEVSDNPLTGWAHYSTTTTSSETITGQPSMTIRWVRARAVRGENDKGPWSDPAKALIA